MVGTARLCPPEKSLAGFVAAVLGIAFDQHSAKRPDSRASQKSCAGHATWGSAAGPNSCACQAFVGAHRHSALRKTLAAAPAAALNSQFPSIEVLVHLVSAPRALASITRSPWHPSEPSQCPAVRRELRGVVDAMPETFGHHTHSDGVAPRLRSWSRVGFSPSRRAVQTRPQTPWRITCPAPCW